MVQTLRTLGLFSRGEACEEPLAAIMTLACAVRCWPSLILGTATLVL